jgi:cob(I)alamin adenosyltransferase
MYSGRGDQGETSLFGSRRVPKDYPLVEAYGSIDELNSYLGVIVSDSRDKRVVAPLREIQKLLFVAGGDAATELHSGAKVSRIQAEDTKRIESMTDDLLRRLPTLRNFILPGGSKTGAQLQFARAICRRTERRLVASSKSEPINTELIRFFNRLSSYLFNLARDANKQSRKKETLWKGSAPSPD